MGVVYKAEDTKLKRLVALKFLPKGLEAHEPERARFLQEAQAASALNHPHICTIHDLQEYDDQQFIVMEYVDGKTLRHMLPLDKMEDVITYAVQIGEALQEAHSHGIIHRDVKPENIMVNTKNQIKIMDFGLAKLKGSLKLTKSSSTVGTLAYMAPEHIQGSGADARSDIFSFGIVLYEMLTGHLPFRGDHDVAMMYSIVNESPEPVQKYRPDVSSELLHILNRALEKDPEDRYQNVHEMVIDLKRLRKETSRVSRMTPTDSRIDYQATLQQTSPQSSPGPPQKRSTSKKIGWTVPGLLVIILCLVAWWIFHSSSRRVTFQAGRASQVTSEPGIKFDQAISPDGKMIAYSGYVNGILRAQVKQVTGGHTICLTDGMPGYQRVQQWSLDGSEIAFLSLKSTYLFSPAWEQFVVPALGGAPRKTQVGVLSPDGKRLAYTDNDTIFTLRVIEGTPEKLATVYSPYSLTWSPDGSSIACVSGNSLYVSTNYPLNIAPSVVCVINTSSGHVSHVTDNTCLNASPVWGSDGSHLFFVSNRDGTRDIYSTIIGRSGLPEGNPVRVTTGLNAFTISISADAKVLAYSTLMYSTNIWSMNIPEVNWISVEKATQVTTGNQVIETVAMSRDGQWLTYDCNREGHQHIFKRLQKGGEPIQLTTNPCDDFAPSWSPDGKMIAFHSFRSGNRDIFIMLNDGTQQQQITYDSTQEQNPDWSPDGNQIVYTSNKSGQYELYIVSKRPGDAGWNVPRQITHDGGGAPRWSPDGRWIAYLGLKDDLRVISTAGGPPRTLISGNAAKGIPMPDQAGWSSDSRTIIFKGLDPSQQSSFWSVPLQGGNPRLLVKFDDPTKQSHRAEFATDGKRLYFTMSKYECDLWKMDLITVGD